MSHGSLILWGKLSRRLLSSTFVLAVFSIAAKASDCPPVLAESAEAYSVLKLKNLDSTGALKGEEKKFSLEDSKGKVSVVRLYATWCPYCKRDIQQLNEKFKSLVSKKKLDLLMVSFESSREDASTVKKFINVESKDLKVDPKIFHWMHSSMKSTELKALTAEKDKPLFPDYQGVPYGLVFDQKGRLRFLGHFTGGDEAQGAHYDMIQALASGKCS